MDACNRVATLSEKELTVATFALPCSKGLQDASVLLEFYEL